MIVNVRRGVFTHAPTPARGEGVVRMTTGEIILAAVNALALFVMWRIVRNDE